MRMRLRDLRVLYLDCQTTGMRPPAAHLLEWAWTFATAAEELPTVKSYVLALPDGIEIPPRVSEITGLTSEDLQGARPVAEVFAEFHQSLAGEPALIHYAQFEKPFLADLYNRFSELPNIPFPIICTHHLSKRVFPNLPSQNIRGAAGFFGIAPGALKRAHEHVRATHQIWRGLVSELDKRGITTLDELDNLKRAAPAKKVRYEYRLDRIKRLELPDQPGIYRMLAKSGEILYVGKATSLKSRVNSYFRGQKNRDRRKLEMLAQVWDLNVTPCATPLEAALMETDEIKKFNPPYNVVLKRGRRHLLFYNHEFSASSQTQSRDFPHGPFRNSNWIEHLRLLYKSLHQAQFEQIFFNPVDPEILRLGWELCRTQLVIPEVRSVRSLLARGMWLHKNYSEPEAEETAVEETEDAAEDEREPTPEEIAGKFERLLRRAAAELLRAHGLSRLLNARIVFDSAVGQRQLQFERGQLAPAKTSPTSNLPWEGLDIDDFDRMSILLSELARYPHKIELDLNAAKGKNSPACN